MEIVMEKILELWMVTWWILCASEFCTQRELQDWYVWNSSITFCCSEWQTPTESEYDDLIRHSRQIMKNCSYFCPLWWGNNFDESVMGFPSVCREQLIPEQWSSWTVHLHSEMYLHLLRTNTAANIAFSPCGISIIEICRWIRKLLGSTVCP